MNLASYLLFSFAVGATVFSEGFADAALLRRDSTAFKPPAKTPHLQNLIMTHPVDAEKDDFEGETVMSEVGRTARLECRVQRGNCGAVHSIMWYKYNQRIYVLSEDAGLSKPEHGFADRFEVDYTRNSSDSWLVIKSASVADEGIYKCEITYVQVSDTCQALHQFNFTTFIKPKSISAYLDNGDALENGTVIGGVTEGDSITLHCQSGPARPIPLVQWWAGSHLITGEMDKTRNGPTGTGKAKLKLLASRADLQHEFQCRAYHPMLQPSPYLILAFQIDVGVRPTKIKMTRLKEPVESETRVDLECAVFGARPPATISWYNGTLHIEKASTAIMERSDGTFDTMSRYSFTASRFDHLRNFSCHATNNVLKDKNERSFRKSLTLHVIYAPIVTVSPDMITVNESKDVLMFCRYDANPPTLKYIKWLRDDTEVEMSIDSYEGDPIDYTSLLIRNTSRADMGNYTCVVANQVGERPSQNFVHLSVYFKPETRVILQPPSPVTASMNASVTLCCDVVEGNPSHLTHVRWFLDGESIVSLPNCTNNTFCGLNPSQLLLAGISTAFHGNWSCIGKNDAGWGTLSPNTELAVYYPPSGVKLVQRPGLVVKWQPMTLYCSVEDRGRPNNTTFRWSRGGLRVTDVTSENYTIHSVSLTSETNFSCTAVNLGGQSEPATLFIKVQAPPTFIRRLPLYFGALMTSEYINMTCRVECSPICSIMWLKNGRRLETGPHSQYYIKNIVIPPDTRTNDFESVQSTLVWNMTSWPGRRLDRILDIANYTCFSTGNTVGKGVKSSTFFGVEYPPENITVSKKEVNVTEGNIPEKIICHAKAYPDPSYQWHKEGESDNIIKGNALILNYQIKRKNGGNYICEASNKHGNSTQRTYINVLYRPECEIIKKEVREKTFLECRAIANPEEVDFTWMNKNENETVYDHIRKIGLKSILTLGTIEHSRTFLCFANNSVGFSTPCEMDVTVLATQEKISHFSAQGMKSWWKKEENEYLINLFAFLSVVVFIFVATCFTIASVCRKKRPVYKYNNAIKLDCRENNTPIFVMNNYTPNPEGRCQNNRIGSERGRWPLRPGVVVHINTSHSLLINSTGVANYSESQEVPNCSRTVAVREKNIFSPNLEDKIKIGAISGGLDSKNIDSSGNKDNRSALKNGALLPESRKTFYENLSFHNIQRGPDMSLPSTSYERRARARRKPCHRRSAKEALLLQSVDDYHESTDPPNNSQNGNDSSPHSSHNTPHDVHQSSSRDQGNTIITPQGDTQEIDV